MHCQFPARCARPELHSGLPGVGTMIPLGGKLVACRLAGEHMGSPLQQAGVGFSVVDCADGLVDFSSTVGQV